MTKGTLVMNGVDYSNGGLGGCAVTKDYVDSKDNEIKNSLLELEPHIVEELPEASINNYTKFYIINDEGNDRLFINLKSNNTYGWFEFKQSGTAETTAELGQAILGTLVLGKE